MYYLSLLPLLSLLYSGVGAVESAYQLDTSFSGPSFFDGFDSLAILDPSGPGRKVSESKARNRGITGCSSPQCSITESGQSGALVMCDCNSSKNGNAGCGFRAPSILTYGTEFNAASGGVYAAEWTSDYIRIGFWSGNNVSEDVESGNPDPSVWGKPQANLQGILIWILNLLSRSWCLIQRFVGIG